MANNPDHNLRRILHSAYSYVRSVESNKAVAAITLDHLIQEQITSLKQGETQAISSPKGEDLGTRPSRWDQLDNLKTQINSVVEAIREAGDDPVKLKKLGIYEGSKTFSSDQQAAATAPQTAISQGE